MNKKKIIKTIGSILFFIIIIPFMLFNLTLLIKATADPNRPPDIGGYVPLVITVDDMKPDINSGDMIFAKETDIEKFKVGDIVCALNENGLITREVVQISSEDKIPMLTVKANINDVQDRTPIAPNQVIGKYVFGIPKVGALIVFTQKPIVIVAIAIIFIGIIFLRKIIINKKERSKEETNIE